MLMDAEQKKEDYKNRLRFKVDEIKRKEEDLLVWEDNVANHEWKVEHWEDNIFSLMREIKLKEMCRRSHEACYGQEFRNRQVRY